MKRPIHTATNLEKVGLRHFLKTQDFSQEELQDILDLMAMLKQARRDNAVPQLFAGKTVAMLFEQPSTRTRVSFETAATILGGHAQFLSPNDIHLGSKESIADTSRVLSRMVDVIMALVDDHKSLSQLAKHSTVPVINGLCDWLHPTQVLADIFTMMEHLPEGKSLEDLTVAFVGDASNVASSLMFICTKFGMEYRHIGPAQYQVPDKWRDIALENCRDSGGKLTLTDDIEAVAGADIVVADSFYWYGQEDEKTARLSTFIPNYVVDQTVLDKAGQDALFMHCLPANDTRETTRDLMDGPRSVIFDQAENRLIAQMALLVYLTHKDVQPARQEVQQAHQAKIGAFLATL